MSRHDPITRIQHMRSHAMEAVEMTADCSRETLDQDRVLNLALVRLVEIVGEAASQVPFEFRQRHSEVPQQQIVGMRNRLIHGYDSVDFDILWIIIQDDLPTLIAQLDNILSVEN